MTKTTPLALCGALIIAAASGSARAAQAPLRMVAIDVEGGAATLFVTPEGRSLLIDTGWPSGMGVPQGSPPTPSSAERIATAAAVLGVHRIDYLIITHYHVDHVGGLADLMARMPVGVFIDHGPNRETPPPNASARAIANAPRTLYPRYVAMTAGHKRLSVKAGDRLRIGSMTLTVVSADATPIAHPLPGAGKPNPACAGVPDMAADGGEENARSVASLITFGKTRIAAFGDLSWNMEKRLACPTDLVGPTDVLVATQHGSDLSGNPADVAALAPTVVVMGNGATKGGDPSAIRTISQTPSVRGFWRLHASVKHPELSGPEDYIANLTAPSNDIGQSIQLSITPAGAIQVLNPRNGFTRTYQARAER